MPEDSASPAFRPVWLVPDADVPDIAQRNHLVLLLLPHLMLIPASGALVVGVVNGPTTAADPNGNLRLGVYLALGVYLLGAGLVSVWYLGAWRRFLAVTLPCLLGVAALLLAPGLPPAVRYGGAAVLALVGLVQQHLVLAACQRRYPGPS